jgi:4-amino-4-deoxy-L-arabinose transferase-like glycosyltransferase
MPAPFTSPFFLLVLALILRTLKALMTTVVARDSVVYLSQAQAVASGSIGEGFVGYYPPLYPVLTAMLSMVFSIHESALIVSIAMGALLLLPFRAFAKQYIENDQSMKVASLLLVFSPAFITISGEILADSLFLTLFVTLAVVLKAYRTGEPSRALFQITLLGVLCGLLSLTRPEGIMTLLGVLVLLKGPKMPADSKPSRGQRAIHSLCFIGVFLLVLSPYILLLKSETGQWTFTRKAGVVIGGMARMTDQASEPVAQLHQHFRDENERQQETVSQGAHSDQLAAIVRARPMLLVRKVIHGLFQSGALLPRTCHVLIFIFGLMGLNCFRKHKRIPIELIVLSAFHLLAVSTVQVQKRYLLVLVPLFIMAAAEYLPGLYQRLGRSHRLLKFALPLLFVVFILPPALKAERRSKGHIHKLAAVLRDEAQLQASRAVELASIDFRVAYYAGVQARRLPRCQNLSELKVFLKRHQITHLCFRKNWQELWCPWFVLEDVGRLAASEEDGRTKVLLIRVRQDL